MRCVSYTRTFSCLPESEIPEDIIIQQNERIKKFIKQKKWTLMGSDTRKTRKRTYIGGRIFKLEIPIKYGGIY